MSKTESRKNFRLTCLKCTQIYKSQQLAQPYTGAGRLPNTSVPALELFRSSMNVFSLHSKHSNPAVCLHRRPLIVTGCL